MNLFFTFNHNYYLDRCFAKLNSSEIIFLDLDTEINNKINLGYEYLNELKVLMVQKDSILKKIFLPSGKVEFNLNLSEYDFFLKKRNTNILFLKKYKKSVDDHLPSALKNKEEIFLRYNYGLA